MPRSTSLRWETLNLEMADRVPAFPPLSSFDQSTQIYRDTFTVPFIAVGYLGTEGGGYMPYIKVLNQEKNLNVSHHYVAGSEHPRTNEQ